MPKLVLVAADGARSELYLHGAHVTSWIPAGESDERLFLSARSRFGPGEAIRGGVPVCFPQFADQGQLPNHGFARVSTWALVHALVADTGAAHAVLRLGDSAATRAQWPHPFAVELEVALSGRSLEIGLAVTNTGPATFEFTGALHTYLRVADVREATVRGLQGARYRDKALGTDGNVERAARVADRPRDRSRLPRRAARPRGARARAHDGHPCDRLSGYGGLEPRRRAGGDAARPRAGRLCAHALRRGRGVAGAGRRRARHAVAGLADPYGALDGGPGKHGRSAGQGA